MTKLTHFDISDRAGANQTSGMDAAAEGARSETPRLAPLLPLVSIIIVNFNYGRFLAQAVASVFAQTYPRIECVLVDNGSTDESGPVIDAAVAAHPSLQIVRRADNGGQTAGCLDGLARTRGPYVIFLDADDYLLPHCVTTHMQVHLSSRVHAGFTSADMLQMVDDEVVVTTNEPTATYLRAKHYFRATHDFRAESSPRATRRDDRGLLRPTPAGLGDLWPSFDADLGGRAHLVSSRQKDWVWSPTSGQCFRRDALDLFRDADGLGALRSQTDLFLATGVNAVCGSILIDEPLFVYRLHGSNVFSSRPQMNGILSYDPARTSQNAELARRLIIDQLVERVGRFCPKKAMAFGYLTTLRHVDFHDQASRGSYAARAVADRFEAVAKAGNVWLTLLFLVSRGVAPGVLWRVLAHRRRRAGLAAR